MELQEEKLSDKHGLTVYLCSNHHTGNNGVHFNVELDTIIKQMAQKKAMEYYGWNTEKFISIFGRNYL